MQAPRVTNLPCVLNIILKHQALDNTSEGPRVLSPEPMATESSLPWQPPPWSRKPSRDICEEDLGRHRVNGKQGHKTIHFSKLFSRSCPVVQWFKSDFSVGDAGSPLVGELRPCRPGDCEAFAPQPERCLSVAKETRCNKQTNILKTNRKNGVFKSLAPASALSIVFPKEIYSNI